MGYHAALDQEGHPKILERAKQEGNQLEEARVWLFENYFKKGVSYSRHLDSGNSFLSITQRTVRLRC